MNPKEKKPAILLAAMILFLFMGIDFILGVTMIPDHFNSFRVQNSIYHHGLQKNVNATAVWGPLFYSFHTNSLSFRDNSTRTIPLKSEKKRILIMGDSHSEGVGVEYQFTFAGRLQDKGHAEGVEILNASAVSYSPKIHYLKSDYLINQKGLEVDEIWVAIDISDLQNEIAYKTFLSETGQKEGEKGKWKRFLKHNSFTFYTLLQFRENKETAKLNQTLLNTKSKRGSLPDLNSIELYKEFFRSFTDEELIKNPDFHGVSEWIYEEKLRELADEGLQLGFDNIRKLNTICRNRKIKLRLSVHPWQTQIMKRDTSDYYVESWKNFCSDENIEFINLYPLFINHENPVMVIKSCYIEGDNHWNEVGHQRVAEYLKEFLN